MKMLRSYISKRWIIPLLCIGLLMAVVKPVEASRSNDDFAAWLQTLAKQTDATGLERQLASLKTSNQSLSRLIQQASQIISKNNDDFNFPVDDAASDIRQLLLVEWNQFKTGNAMTAVPVIEAAKPCVAPSQQKSFSGGKDLCVLRSEHAIAFPSRPVAFLAIGSYPAHRLVPMVNGIAIGAP